MMINPRNVLVGLVLGSLVASSAQAGPLRSVASGLVSKVTRAGGQSQGARRLLQPASGSATQSLKNKVTQTLNQPGRPSLSTMDVIKAGNLASDLKGRVLNHQFTPSTMDVIKAGNVLSEVKGRVLNHQLTPTPSTMDVIKFSNALSELEARILNR